MLMLLIKVKPSSSQNFHTPSELKQGFETAGNWLTIQTNTSYVVKELVASASSWYQ